VLLAEDDPNDTFLVQRAFKKAKLPHNLVHLIDGQHVLDYLCGIAPYQHSPGLVLPDLLLLDLKMPRLDGFQVLEWLQRRPEFKAMPAVVMSSSDHFSDIKRAIALGAADYFRKPSDPADLLSLVTAIHERWLRRERPVTGAVAAEPPHFSEKLSTAATAAARPSVNGDT